MMMYDVQIDMKSRKLAPYSSTRICLFLRNRGFRFSDKRSFEPLGRFEVFMKEYTAEYTEEYTAEFDSTPLRAVVGFWSRLSPSTGLLVFPLGTLTSQAFACASEIEHPGVQSRNSERQGVHIDRNEWK